MMTSYPVPNRKPSSYGYWQVFLPSSRTLSNTLMVSRYFLSASSYCRRSARDMLLTSAMLSSFLKAAHWAAQSNLLSVYMPHFFYCKDKSFIGTKLLLTERWIKVTGNGCLFDLWKKPYLQACYLTFITWYLCSRFQIITKSVTNS